MTAGRIRGEIAETRQYANDELAERDERIKALERKVASLERIILNMTEQAMKVVPSCGRWPDS